jgi:hypothetical protein
VSLAGDLRGNIADVLGDPEIGTTVTLTLAGVASYDEATGGTTAAAPVVLEDVPALVLGYRDREVDGTRILVGDRKVIVQVEGLARVPRTGESWTIETAAGEAFTIVSVRSVQIGGEVVHVMAQCRQGGKGEGS